MFLLSQVLSVEELKHIWACWPRSHLFYFLSHDDDWMQTTKPSEDILISRRTITSFGNLPVCVAQNQVMKSPSLAHPARMNVRRGFESSAAGFLSHLSGRWASLKVWGLSGFVIFLLGASLR